GERTGHRLTRPRASIRPPAPSPWRERVGVRKSVGAVTTRAPSNASGAIRLAQVTWPVWPRLGAATWEQVHPQALRARRGVDASAQEAAEDRTEDVATPAVVALEGD